MSLTKWFFIQISIIHDNISSQMSEKKRQGFGHRMKSSIIHSNACSLIHKRCHSKRYHSDIKYHMTLNSKGGLNCVLGARWLRASWVTSPGIGTFTLQTPLLTRHTYYRGPSAMAKSVLVLNSGSSSLKWVPNLRSRSHLTVALSLSSFVRHISCSIRFKFWLVRDVYVSETLVCLLQTLAVISPILFHAEQDWRNYFQVLKWNLLDSAPSWALLWVSGWDETEEFVLWHRERFETIES